MDGEEASKNAGQVTYVIGVAIRGPITSDDYEVGKVKIILAQC